MQFSGYHLPPYHLERPKMAGMDFTFIGKGKFK
jgi:hypothetical protein